MPVKPPNENTRLLKANGKLSLQKPLKSVTSSQSLRSLIVTPSIDQYKTNNGNDDLSTLEFRQSNFDLWSYFTYYFPIFKWLPQYNFKQSFIGDFLAGISLASFQIPLVMSITKSLAHLHPLVGLYSIIVGAFAYSIFGTVPVLIVGPSPSSALIYGTVIESFHHLKQYSLFSQLEISSALSFCLGGILLGAGILRLGFLDNVLSRSLLKGFIGAMGLIMIINELAIELGILELSLTQPHSTTLDKFLFIISNYKSTHLKTFFISSITLFIVLAVRTFKNIMINKYNKKSAIYIPELLLMVIVGTFLCYYNRWDLDGIDIVGDITKVTSAITSTTKSTAISTSTSISTAGFNNPFKISKLSLYTKVFSTSFLCTILGYFDSVTAAKSLGIKNNYNVSSNRELVALGVTNLIISLFGGLPSFGALGRSKINMLSGATTPMALIIMGIAVSIAIKFLLQLLFYLPECILALSTTIIGITVLEEIPHDLHFFWNIGGYDEILTFALVFITTLLISVQGGVLLGVTIAIVRVIKHSTKSRIQILGRVPNTAVFRNADELIEESFITYNDDLSTDEESDRFSNLVSEIEDIEGVLIVKIPESLNFANVGDLRNRLDRIEKYGSLLIHPSQPRKRNFNNDDSIKFIIIDCKGMDYIDSSATQLLFEIVSHYCNKNKIEVCFTRISLNANVRNFFKKSGLVKLINETFTSSTNLANSTSTASSILGASSSNSVTTSSGLGNGFFLSIEEALKSIDLKSV